MRIVEPILIGRRKRIEELALQNDLPIDRYEIVQQEDDTDACRLAVRLVREKEADALMKGLVPTAVLLKAILDKENGIRGQGMLSHIGLFFVQAVQRFLLLTDAAVNIAPDVKAKKKLIENAVDVMRLLGVPCPKVACVCAVERVSEAMPATLDAQELVRLNQIGELTGCQVGGPLALDNALFAEAARRKQITDPVAGQPDILLMPNIEAGNVLYKALAFLCDSPGAGLLVGAAAPVILTSRSDPDETKLHSITLALYLAALKKETPC